MTKYFWFSLIVVYALLNVADYWHTDSNASIEFGVIAAMALLGLIFSKDRR